jgi:mRNA interferase MazF
MSSSLTKNKYNKGDVVLVSYPFTNLKQSKVRPAILLRDQFQEDILVCPISTRIKVKSYELIITDEDYDGRILPVPSCIRTHNLFSLHASLVQQKVTRLSDGALQKLLNLVTQFVNNHTS